MQNFAFGSVSGTTFAFYFFLLIAVFIGVATYRLLREPKLGGAVRVPLAATTGVGMALLVFLGIYFSSLDGFYRLDFRQDTQEIRLEYIFPARTLLFHRGEIAEVRRVPAYKSRWQLVLYTPTGAQFTSARATYADVRKAWDVLTAQPNLSPKTE